MKIKMGQVKLGSHLPDGASKNIFFKKNSYKDYIFISGNVGPP